MRSLSLDEVLEIYRRILEIFGGAGRIRDPGVPESAVAQPPLKIVGATGSPVRPIDIV